MAVQSFPSIKPSSRVWTPGSKPQSIYTSQSGYEVRIQHGSLTVGSQLSLGFQNLLEVVGKQITDHYAIAQGSFETFALPVEIFAGMATYDYITATSTTWRYGRPPSVTYIAPGIQSINVELVAVPG
jgi:hypothetical protein